LFIMVIDSIPIHRDSFMKIILVAGARPNFVKIAPIIRAIKSFNQINWSNQTNLSRLPRSKSVRGEMRPALWSVETTTCEAYFTGTKQTKQTKETK